MTICPELLKIGEEYSRAELAELFDAPDLATSREGWYPRDRYDYVPFFVTLNKETADPSVAYNDYFEDGLFFWESQNQNTLGSKWIRKITQGQLVPLLFVREVAKVKGVTQKFAYAGRLSDPLPDLRSSQPVKFTFEPSDLTEPLSENIKVLVEWSPGDERRAPLRTEFSKAVERKRKKTGPAGQGYETDPKVRYVIETRAMEVAKKSYERHGYQVEDVSGYRPYDLVCSKPGVKQRRMEVKGTRGSASVVNLTVGEVIAAREPSSITDLFIVYQIQISRLDDAPVASEGKVYVIQGWVPKDVDLESTQYRYKVPLVKPK